MPIKKKNGVAMIEEERTEHLSPSMINMLKRCEAAFWFRYVCRLKIPPTGALVLGSSYDDALTTNYLQKIKTKNDLEIEDVVDAFITSFNERKQDAELQENESADKMKDVGVKLVQAYQKTVSPSIQPIAAQKEYNVKFPGVDWILKGISDVETKNGEIHDNKTSGKTPGKRDGEYLINPDHHFQMLCYSMAKKMESGINAGNKLYLDYAIKVKYPRVVTIQIPPPSPSDMKHFQIITATSRQKIELLKRGYTQPLPNRSNMMCSRKYCGFWAECEKKFGGTVKE
jgi:hypothetical protein